jgi:TolB-like protein/tetratricopeptide (TPR) repeat protein
MLAPGESRPHRYRFGLFEFDSASGELSKGGIRIPLQPQPARLLSLLLGHAGELVSREVIREALWGSDTTVDFEVGVNRCVRQLRAALLDDAEAPHYIETMPRRGYRFIGSSVSLGAKSPQSAPAPLPDALSAREAPSVAVLPFANLSGNPDDDYFSDGLAEEITNALVQIPELKVIARTSAFSFKGKNEDVRKIGQTLGVTTILEGSVRRFGGRIRVTAQLVQTADGSHLTSKRYDREMTDVFAIQDEIAADVATQLQLSLVAPKRPTPNLAAYEAFLEGRFHWHRYTPTGFEKARHFYERAVALDPNFAPAYTGLAEYYVGIVFDAGAPAREYLPRAAAAARRAIEVDESHAEAHAVLGQVSAMLDYDWLSGERHFRRARELSSSTYVRMSYVMWYLLPRNLTEEAVEQCDALIATDPLLLSGRTVKATALMFAGEYEAAADACLRALEFDPVFPKALQMLGYVRILQRRVPEAFECAEKLLKLVGRSHLMLITLGMAYGAAGDVNGALGVIEELRKLPGSSDGGMLVMAYINMQLGRNDASLDWLTRAVEARDPRVLWIGNQPWARLHGDPTHTELLRTMHLPSAS